MMTVQTVNIRACALYFTLDDSPDVPESCHDKKKNATCVKVSPLASV